MMIVAGEATVYLTTYIIGAQRIVSPLPRLEWLATMPRWLTAALLVAALPVIEEFLFRGVLFDALRRSFASIWPAAIVTTVAWALIHAVWPLQIVAMYLVFGLALAWVRVSTDRLWPCIAAHAAYNAIPAAVLLIYM